MSCSTHTTGAVHDHSTHDQRANPRVPRVLHHRPRPAPQSIAAFTLTSELAHINFGALQRLPDISPRPILLITGDNAHSRWFSDDVYAQAAEPKELFVVPGARHTRSGSPRACWLPAHGADRRRWQLMDGQQGGDPAKLAAALVQLASLHEPPLRWVAGADAVAAIEQKANTLLAQAGAHRELSSSLGIDDTGA